MDYILNVCLTTYRVEILELLKKELEKCDVVMLEQPDNKLLYDYLEGRKNLSEYVEEIDTNLPVFTAHLLEILKKMHEKGVIILQVEPYLENLERIYMAIDGGELENVLREEDVRIVHKMEKRTTKMLIEYQEAFLEGDFDALVDATINFTKADAERFKVRDYMRAMAIRNMIEELEPSSIFVEAGQMHFLLPEYLSRMLENTEIMVTRVVEKLAENCNLKLIPNPGNLLTEEYIRDNRVDEEEERLMAARGLVYISMIKKEEMLPTDENPCPHLVDEAKVADFVYGLSYNDCRRKFGELWSSINRNKY